MRKYQKWLLAEIPIMVLMAVTAVVVAYGLNGITSEPIALIIACAFYFRGCDFLLSWYHRDVSIEDKFYHADDDD